MAKIDKKQNVKANESVSKYKLLSAYGGPGSLVHTQYGSIIISCIEEWGFLKKVSEIHSEFVGRVSPEKLKEKVIEDARREINGSIGISNDSRLLESLQMRKNLPNLLYLVLVPDIEISSHNNRVGYEGAKMTIPSTYMPKVFSDNKNYYNTYDSWFKRWVSRTDINGEKRDQYGESFHPPKYESYSEERFLRQDNITLLCEHGHISDFPWSKFLRWRKDEPLALFEEESVPLFNAQECCNNPKIRITSNSGNASGFDGKWLKCANCNQGVSLKGIMGAKLKCPGHKPWEAKTGAAQYYTGDSTVRSKESPYERCECRRHMKVALTTGNNIYYSRILSSIFLHNELFESDLAIEILNLEKQLKEAMNLKDFLKCTQIQSEIEELQKSGNEETEELTDSENDIVFRYNEYCAFKKEEELLNLDAKHLKVKNVTEHLDENNKKYFDRVLRIDNMKITSVQLDFSRVIPVDADAENALPKNIFRSQNDSVEVYPAVESFGEGVFFSFNHDEIINFIEGNENILELQKQLEELHSRANDFNRGAISFANVMNWQMYLVHTFSHLIMRELEFRCGYPTASLSERIYVSNEEEHKMYGCLIYTAEGSEGSMGGLIAQTRPKNLNNLIKSALMRATVCNSDPLCWESKGQGLFDLNFASCFSCSLVSETSCEHSNLYLDRKILVDENDGFFKDILQ